MAPTTPDEYEPSKLEADLAALVARSRRVLWLVVFTQGALLLVALAAIAYLSVSGAADRHRIAVDESTVRTAECDQHATIATITIPDTAAKPLLSFVESSRKAFVVLHCPGSIGAPQANLIRLGRKYGVPVRY